MYLVYNEHIHGSGSKITFFIPSIPVSGRYRNNMDWGTVNVYFDRPMTVCHLLDLGNGYFFRLYLCGKVSLLFFPHLHTGQHFKTNFLIGGHNT